jgi:hypothetical protein
MDQEQVVAPRPWRRSDLSLLRWPPDAVNLTYYLDGFFLASHVAQ